MAAPLETGQGQTGTVDASKVDCSKMASLQNLNQVLIKQPMRGKEILCEMFCGCEMENLYTIQEVNEEAKTATPLFTLKEESNCCLRQCCKAQRPLVLNATYPDQTDQEPLFIIDKPYRMGCCCCAATNCMGRNYMEVFVGGVCLGSVREKCLCNCRVAYAIFDSSEVLLCSVERCACYCECMDVKFEILTPEGEETGKTISKLFGGFLKEMFTTNDNFQVEFPDFMDTIPKKLLMICAAMMIEFRHFEQKGE